MSLTDLLIMSEQIEIADGLIYALIGFAFVFIGIGILIGVLYGIGAVLQKLKAKKVKKEQAPVQQTQVETVQSQEVPNEVKAAIIAAIMAYYNLEKPKCDFVVKKIKRIY